MEINKIVEQLRSLSVTVAEMANKAERRALDAEARALTAETRLQAVAAALNLEAANDDESVVEPVLEIVEAAPPVVVEPVIVAPVEPSVETPVRRVDLGDLAVAISKAMGGKPVSFDGKPVVEEKAPEPVADDEEDIEALSDELRNTIVARVEFHGDYFNYNNRAWEITEYDPGTINEYERFGDEIKYTFQESYHRDNRRNREGGVSESIVLLLDHLAEQEYKEWAFELNEGAVFQALTYEWQTVSQLFMAAKVNGYSKGISTIRNVMNRNHYVNLGLQARFPTLIERGKNAQGHLAWRLIAPVYDDPDGGETVEETAPVEAPSSADEVVVPVDFTKRKRCPTAKRTARFTLNLPREHYQWTYFKLPSITWDWSKDGHADRVARSHPFFDWWYATAVGEWALTRDTEGSFAIALTDPADIKTMLATGMTKEEPGSVFSLSYRLNLTRFDAELAQKEAEWKDRAAKAQKGSTKCAAYARTVFRDPKLIKELEASPDWHPIKLPPMKRLPTWGKDTVTRDHPTKAGEIIKTHDYPTVLAGNDTLQRLWEIKSDEWIITAPPLNRFLGGSGYGPTTVEDAVLWARDADDVLFKAAL